MPRLASADLPVTAPAETIEAAPVSAANVDANTSAQKSPPANSRDARTEEATVALDLDDNNTSVLLNPIAELTELMLSAFSAAELRELIMRLPDAASISSYLRPSGADKEIIMEFVEVMKRRGNLNGDFFSLLQEFRPKRKHEFAQLESRFQAYARRSRHW